MITFSQLWDRQAAWSERTFGVERGPVGPLRHLLRELGEVASASPADAVLEWADVLILAIDAARRAGFKGAEMATTGQNWADAPPVRSLAEVLLADALRGEFPQSRYEDLIDAVCTDATGRAGLCQTDLIAAAYVKVLINERRAWSAPDAEGVCEHVRADAAPEWTKNPQMPGVDAVFSNTWGWVPRP